MQARLHLRRAQAIAPRTPVRRCMSSLLSPPASIYIEIYRISGLNTQTMVPRQRVCLLCPRIPPTAHLFCQEHHEHHRL